MSTRPATGQVYRWTPSCTLPVELLSFSGQNRGIKNVLEWITAGESKNDFFTVEKSTDGTEFSDFAHIKGAGTTTEKQQYSLWDDELSETVYYRLRQTDFDGKQTYYETIVIFTQKENPPLYPNPVAKVVILESEEGIYELYDSNGRLVCKGFLDYNLHEVDVSRLPEGAYFLRVNNGKSRPIIVRH